MKEPDISRKLTHFLKTFRKLEKMQKVPSDKLELHSKVNRMAI